jgi:hypothetical protein
MKRKMIPVITLGFLLLAAVLVILRATCEPRIRIMPLGDSITQGAADADSYRRPLWNRPAHSDFDMDHEGHWGWRADEVLVKIDGWAEQAAPDIVLLHLGTNDILQMQDNKDTVVELRQIILVLRKHNPRVEILLAQLIPLAGTTANVQVQKLNGLLPDMAQSITTDDSPVHIVNQYEGFDAFKDTNDGIHPNESGIVKMAQRWHEALSDRLKSQR